ncbi:MAG: polymer-forming cytoskeletal protein [Cyanothece sp. SIO1E1]|nr:polymer-forming cytoskeletal protein [Cyanothece sp. SIO1E1]
MNESSQLQLSDTFMRGKVEIHVDGEQAKLNLDNTEFERLSIEGKGTAVISGNLEAQLPGEGESGTLLGPFFLNTAKYEFLGADIRSKSGTTEFSVGVKYVEINSSLMDRFLTFDFDGFLVDGEGLIVNQVGKLEATRIGFNTVLNMGASNTYSMDDLAVDGNLVMQNGNPTFQSSVSGSGKILGRPTFNPQIPTALPFIVFEGTGSENIEVSPGFELKFPDKALVKEGTTVYLNDTDSFDKTSGTLVAAEWQLENNSELYFDSTELLMAPNIAIIGPAASLILGENSRSNGFPSRDTDLTVKGSLVLNSGCILEFGGARIEGTLTQAAGSEVRGAVQSVRGDLGGVIELAGRITGETVVDGSTQLGASPGTGVIDGDITMGEEHELEIEFAGTDPGLFDQLEVTGTANLNGKLMLYFLDGYEPSGDEQFEIIKAPSITGGFTEINQTRLGRNVRFDFAVGDTGLLATAMPLVIESYADWRAAFFTQSDAADDAISGPDEDPEGDGWTNRMEYLFDGNPNVPEGSPVTFTLEETATPDAYSVQATFDRIASVTDVVWSFEVSDDLESWTEVAATESSQTPNGNYVTSVVHFDEAVDASERIFVRLSAKEVL